MADLCYGLRDSNVAVSCVVANSSYRDEVDYTHKFPVYKMGSLGQFFSTPLSKNYIKMAGNFDADLIHVHLPNPLATVSLMNSRTPFVVTYHCDVLSYPLLNKLYEPITKSLLKKARAIIVSSVQTRDYSYALRDFQGKIKVIPFGVCSKDFELNSNSQSVYEWLKLKYPKRVFVFAGRLVKYKGLQNLLYAMKNVRGSLLIVGDGPEKNKLKKLTKQLRLDSKVRFFENTDRSVLGAFYRASDAVVLPSIDKREAFGICLIEALSCGKPLVTTRIDSGVQSVNIHNQTGLVVPPQNQEALSQALNSLLEDTSQLKRLSQGAKVHFERNFGRDRMIKSHMDIYRKVLFKSPLHK